MDGDEESSVEIDGSVRFDYLDQRVDESLELSAVSLSNIETGEVKMEDEAKRSGFEASSGSEISGEELTENLLLVKTIEEDFLVGIIERQVQGRKETDEIGEVSTSEDGETSNAF